MRKSAIKYASFPRTEPPPSFVELVVERFRAHETEISTDRLQKGLTSDEVLKRLSHDLIDIGFEVETGKKKDQKIERPVFFGDNGIPQLNYQIDAYHLDWKCGLEIEAGRAWMGNAVYRDLIQAAVMVGVEYLCLAVPNAYKFNASGRTTISRDFENTRSVADAIYGHSRMQLPYRLVLIGY